MRRFLFHFAVAAVVVASFLLIWSSAFLDHRSERNEPVQNGAHRLFNDGDSADTTPLAQAINSTTTPLAQAINSTASTFSQTGGTVHIRVEDESGRAVVNVEVGLIDDSDEFLPATRDSQGRYIVENLPPGQYRAVAAGEETLQGTDGAPVTIDARSLVETKLTLPGSSWVDVEVQTSGGSPAAGLLVYAAPTRMATSRIVFAHEIGAGRYRVGPLRSGVYAIQATDGYNPAVREELMLNTGESRALALTHTSHQGRISGRVLNSRVGGAIPDLEVTAVHNSLLISHIARGDSGIRDIGRARTDAQGDFTLSGLAPDMNYHLSLRKGDELMDERFGVATGDYVEIMLDAL